MTTPMGYKLISTFWEDFSIADKFGTRAVEDTFDRAFAEWKDDTVYMTELVLVLNWKIWNWYEKNEELAELYNSLWEKAESYVFANFDKSAIQYFLRITD